MNRQNDELDLLHQLGKRIAYLRKQKRMSQLGLSLSTGISKSHLSDVECGRRNPSLLTLGTIAQGLGVTLEELFRGIVSL
ncbi:MAG: helix-turn-helix transcriptional regulator, partial [Bacilli bacterium]|nr:helix-turn-helix transcriptional regulator [Bacilli bacterium]